jgi:GMP synthase-like glutamine amidotransferase
MHGGSAVKFLVFQHLAVEHPGVFREFMRQDGITWDTVELDIGERIPPLSDYDALLVFGGPMDVWQEEEHPWLIAEKTAIRSFVNDMRRPFLGICLGHQLLASALGGTVGRMARPEVGISDLRLTAAGSADPLFAGLTQPMTCVQWHGAEVQRLPEHAVVLAENDACPVQAMRVHDHAYGLQYHVEIDERTMTEWGEIPAYRRALEAVKGRAGQAELERAVAQGMGAFRATAQAIYRRLRGVAATRARSSTAAPSAAAASA